MKRHCLLKRMIVGILLMVMLSSTVLMVHAREVDPKPFGLEFYLNEGSSVKYTKDTYHRALLADYGYAQGTSVGGDVSAIGLTIYHCNNKTLVPDFAMTKTESARYGYTHLLYINESVDYTCYTRLQGKTSYAEAMISGYWMP